jgi:hypothetical protein
MLDLNSRYDCGPLEYDTVWSVILLPAFRKTRPAYIFVIEHRENWFLQNVCICHWDKSVIEDN